jgi:predicted SAM-dependent methyltransferase
MKVMHIASGITTFIPWPNGLGVAPTGGTDSARYCYSVWLRHLEMARINKLNTNPKVVAELGPGDSLGIGLAALLSGAEKYYAFDVVEHASVKRNLEIFGGIVSLFKGRADIPGELEFPEVKPYLENYKFPNSIFSDERLNKALGDARIDRIRESIDRPNREGSMIEYRVPWFDRKVLKQDSIDVIYSQAVLEHVEDLVNAYQCMHAWLKPHGFISHQIDFRCHGTADLWNGHWTYSNFVWKLIRGKRPYLVNREPYSAHLRLLSVTGFHIVFEKKVKSQSNISRDNLATKFKHLSDDDLTTSGAFIQAIKR